MGFKHKTFAARAEFFLETFTPRYVSSRMQVSEVESFQWPADDIDLSVKHVQMGPEEARLFLAMLCDDVEEKRTASERDAERLFQLEMVRAQAIQGQRFSDRDFQGSSPPHTPTVTAPASSFEGDELEGRKLSKALEVHDSCRKEGHIGCNSETVRKMITTDAPHAFNKFMERRKITFDSMSKAEQSLIMNPPFDVSGLPVAAQDWLRASYAVKCYHLELLFIQAEIFRVSKHIPTIASIKESIDTRKPRFVKEEPDMKKKK